MFGLRHPRSLLLVLVYVGELLTAGIFFGVGDDFFGLLLVFGLRVFVLTLGTTCLLDLGTAILALTRYCLWFLRFLLGLAVLLCLGYTLTVIHTILLHNNLLVDLRLIRAGWSPACVLR